jgi:DnaJ-class molecular chaperone
VSSFGPRTGTGTAEPVDGELDYYQLLGVPYQATTAEITRAYRTAMKRAHPDHQGPGGRAAAEEQAKLLNHAFTTLSKPSSRSAYDTKIRARMVQDQIMSHYIGGFAVSGSQTADPFARHLRRQPTYAERQERAQSDRKAIVHLLVLFAFVMLVFVAALLLWAALTALVGAVV